MINYLSLPICRICGKPEDKYFNNGLCEDCCINKPPFAMARSVALYEGVLKAVIHKFKFNGKKRLAGVLGKLMMTYLEKSGLPLNDIDAIIPVPLSVQRVRERGYNQSLLLAEVISKAANITLDVKSLKKTRDVTPQFELKRSERFLNIKGAFKADIIYGRKVLLVDDIYTTGATATEAARALKNAGAIEVYVLTPARAVD